MIPAPSPTHRKGWGWVGLLCATATASYLCRVNVSVAGVLLREELHLSQAQMGRVFSAFLLGYALFMVPAGSSPTDGARGGFSSGRRGGGRRSRASSSLVGRGPLASASSATLAPSSSCASCSASARRRPSRPRRAASRGGSLPGSRARANGFVVAAIALGSALAPPLLSAVMVRWGWRAALAVSALPALATSRSPGALAGEPADGRWRVRARRPARAAPPPSARRASSCSRSATRCRDTSATSSSSGSTSTSSRSGTSTCCAAPPSAACPGCCRSCPSRSGGGSPTASWPAGDTAPAGGSCRWPAWPWPASSCRSARARRTPGSSRPRSPLSTALVLCVEGPFWATMTEIAGGRSGAGRRDHEHGQQRRRARSRPALTPVAGRSHRAGRAPSTSRPFSPWSPPCSGSASTRAPLKARAPRPDPCLRQAGCPASATASACSRRS